MLEELDVSFNAVIGENNGSMSRWILLWLLSNNSYRFRRRLSQSCLCTLFLYQVNSSVYFQFLSSESGIIPPELGNLGSLRTLTLQRNRLSGRPKNSHAKASPFVVDCYSYELRLFEDAEVLHTVAPEEKDVDNTTTSVILSARGRPIV